ncbi:MAG: EF-hand domain-containing protein [Hyphomicrobium sp.]|nr:EF-hand domain-containing protein [Hyphomicrobium sp.]
MMTRFAPPKTRLRPLAAVMVVAASMCGCSSVPSLTGGSPFGSTSSIDRTFIGAAQTWDFDKDGTVTCDEWKNYLATLLRESDGNGDGSLDDAEFKQMAKTDQLFSVADRSYFDANGDGKVTVEELTGKQNAAFKQLDKNGDCRIDRNESVRVLQVDAPKGGTAPNTDQQVPSGR